MMPVRVDGHVLAVPLKRAASLKIDACRLDKPSWYNASIIDQNF